MRLYDWEARLAAYVSIVAREGFEYGRHDCALFAAGGVEAVTGEDPADAWRGQYFTLKQGLKLVREAGFADHVSVAERLFPAIHRAQAMPGDLAVITTAEAGDALGIVQGEMVYVLTEGGLGLVPIEAASAVLGVR